MTTWAIAPVTGETDLPRRVLLAWLASVGPAPTWWPPVLPPSGARAVLSVYGAAREHGGHHGLDLRAEVGAEVRAVWPGRAIVVYPGPDDGEARQRAGIFVSVASPIPPQAGDEGPPQSVVIEYMHLADATVANGGMVLAGQLLGHAGRSGVKQAATHLHLQAWHAATSAGYHGPRRWFDPDVFRELVEAPPGQ